MSEPFPSREQAKQEGRGHVVTATCNGEPVRVAQGCYLVSELKTKLGVALDLELDEIQEGQFIPLRDGDPFNVKEGDVFVSHVRRGGYS